MLMRIRLTLEGDVTVGIALARQPDEPLHHIPEVETYHQQLQHLAGVDVLMIHRHRIHLHPPAGKDDAAEVDGRESLEGQEAIVDDHFLSEW